MPEITITIKRRLKNLDSETKQYLLDNMYRRHQLYNQAIRYLIDESYINPNVTAYDVAKKLYNEFEKTDPMYNYYATGIREQVIRSVYQMMDRVNFLSRDYNPKISGKYDTIEKKYRFHKFVRSKQSFSFNTKVLQYPSGKYASKVKCINGNSITIAFNKNIYKTFVIREEKFNNRNHPYTFEIHNIRIVHFLYKNGHFYILLTINANSDSCMSETTLINRKPLAGIDVGERNPIALSDDGVETNVKIIKFPDEKIEKLNRRIDILQNHLDKKIKNSNNYYKVLDKINRIKERQANIRLDWRNKLAYDLVTSYNILEIDTFYINIIRHGTEEWNNIPDFNRRCINRKLYNRGIWDLQVTIEKMANKYISLFSSSTINSTIICNKCGHENHHPTLVERQLTCNHCGHMYDRDVNASVVCYLNGLYKHFGIKYNDVINA